MAIIAPTIIITIVPITNPKIPARPFLPLLEKSIKNIKPRTKKVKINPITKNNE